MQFGLPSGQAVARALGETPLSDEKILIGQANGDAIPNIVDAVGAIFAGNYPLWTCVLAEAAQYPVTESKTITSPQLGPVGGRIIAEVFLGLIFADPGCYLRTKPEWAPAPGYALRDFVRFATG